MRACGGAALGSRGRTRRLRSEGGDGESQRRTSLPPLTTHQLEEMRPEVEAGYTNGLEVSAEDKEIVESQDVLIQKLQSMFIFCTLT